MFSGRLPRELHPSELWSALETARAKVGAPLDLTESNPTLAGIFHDSDDVRRALAVGIGIGQEAGIAEDVARYRPTPQGLLGARDAIASYYAERGASVPVDDIFLCSSTSEAYSWLFRLLCDPGDEILVPRPSYPLFDALAGLDAVVPIGYSLRHHAGWFLEAEEVTSHLTARTRALVVVHPNNPTGSYVKRAEHRQLAELCTRQGLALIADEVFLDYPTSPADPARAPTLATTPSDGPLTFVLSGLSKVAGLPQLKLGWILLRGAEPHRAEARERLAHIADAYLSVSAPIARAAPVLLGELRRKRAPLIAERVAHNRRALAVRLAGSPIQLLESEGGWSAMLRVPSTRTETEWVLALAERGVLVHPGFFYDCDTEGYLVASLLPTGETLDDAARHLIHLADLH